MYILPHKTYEASRLEGIAWTRVMHGVPLRRVEFFSGTASPGLYGFMHPCTDVIHLSDTLQEGHSVYEKEGVQVHETLHQFNHQADE